MPSTLSAVIRTAVLPLLVLISTACSSVSPAPERTPRSTPQPSQATSAHPPDPAPARSSADLPDSLLATEWTTLPANDKVVALTFDAGANNAGVESILRTLRDMGVEGTFFLTGRWTEIYPDQARLIGSAYPVGNHTYDHPYLTGLSSDAVRSEVTRAADLIRAATGVDDRPLFRFPYGDSDVRTIDVVNGLGYGGIRWTVDTLGWKGTSGKESVDSILRRVLDALRPGAIVLMHVGSNPDDGSTLDADALPRMISEIRARGYRFVTVDQYL